MHDRMSLSPRPHLTPQPRAAVLLPNAESPAVGSPTTAIPAVSQDSFAQARRLWGRNRTPGGERYRAVRGGEVSGKREGAGSLRIAAVQTAVK
jgi:hypothetical protein